MSRRSWLFVSALITLAILADISAVYQFFFGSDLNLRTLSGDEVRGSAVFEIVKRPLYAYSVLFAINAGSILGFIQRKKSN